MVISPATPLVLGSRSPRRRELLGSLGVPFESIPGDADETRRAGENAAKYLERVARGKLTDVAERVSDRARVPAILVADTIVVVDDDVLGKPADVAEAARLLGRIAGRTHVVHTRYAISVAPELAVPKIERTVESRVTIRKSSTAELARYAATGEGLDKAGAYAAQGIGAFLVERIEGSFSNVVGLPVCEVVLDLLATGLLADFPGPP